MKVNYLPKSRPSRLYTKRILILIAVFIFGLIGFYFARSIVISAAASIWKVKNVVISGENVMPVIDRRSGSGLVVATVLSYPPQTPYDVITIDAGSSDFISLGAEVSMPEGPILGIVSEVFPRSAKVKLFSASGEKTTAVLERNNTPVILEGRGGGNFKVSLPRDITAEKGDRILSPDITSRLLAVVGDISMESTDAFKEVLAVSPTHIFSLRFVFVKP